MYADYNNNGVRDPNEPGLPNVSVTISGTAFAGTPFARPLVGSDIPGGSLTILTDATGRWEFSPIPPGTYTIAKTSTPAGYTDGALQNADPALPPPTVVGESFTNLILAPFPVRGPFNFAEILLPSAVGNIPPITFFPPTTGADDSKRQFLASTTATVTAPATGGATTPNFAAVVAPSATRPTVYAVTAEDIGGGMVRVFNYSSGVEQFRFQPFGNFTGGVRVAVADVTGDGVPDIIVAPGIGGGPIVEVFDGRTGAMVTSFTAFDPSFRGGLEVGAGVFAKGQPADIVVTPDAGGGPIVRVFTFAGTMIANFTAFSDGFRGGLQLAVGDINHDGIADIAVTAGPGGGPRVAAFDGSTITTTATRLFNDFFAFAPELRTGFNIAIGDTNGDGFADLILGAGQGGSPRVGVYDGSLLAAQGTPVLISSFFAGDPNSRSGARIAAADLAGTGKDDIISSSGSGVAPIAYIYNPLTGTQLDSFYAFPIDFTDGVRVAAG